MTAEELEALKRGLKSKQRQLQQAKELDEELEAKWGAYTDSNRPVDFIRDYRNHKNRIKSLEDKIAELGAKIETASIDDESAVTEKEATEHEKKIVDLRFTNRLRELKQFSDPTAVAPFLVIDAPGEFGKTKLLKALINAYETSDFVDWKCFSHKVLADDSYYSILKSLYAQISPTTETLKENLSDDDAINQFVIKLINASSKSGEYEKKNGFTIILDNLERCIEPDPSSSKATKVATWLLGTFIPELFEQLGRTGLLQQKRLKFIFAGRYITTMVKREAGNLTIANETLEPFGWHAVQGAVENEVQNLGLSPNAPDIDQHTAQMMYHTGGHPGYLSALLTKVIETRFTPAPDRFYQANIEIFYQAYIKRTIEEIRETIRKTGETHKCSELLGAVETLVPFRRFNTEIIRDLKEQGKLTWSLSPWNLIKMMGSLYMVKYERDYYRDSIARNLLVVRLRQNEPERFKDLCETAVTMYKKDLYTAPCQIDPAIAFIEWLYQMAQLAAFDQSKKHELRTLLTSQNIKEHISKVSPDLTNPEKTIQRFRSLIVDLAEDEDLTFMLNFALQGEQWKRNFNPLSELNNTIENMIKNIEEQM